MLAFIKKHYKSILIIILLVIPINGMIRYKLLAETTTSIGTFHQYNKNFEGYKTMLIIVFLSIILFWLFNFWKQYKLRKNIRINIRGTLIKQLRSFLIVILLVISINGITSFKLLNEKTVTKEILGRYDDYFSFSQTLLIALLTSIVLFYLFDTWIRYKKLKNKKIKFILSKRYKIVLTIILLIISINGMIYFKLLGEKSTTLEALYKYDTYFIFFQILLTVVFLGVILSWLFSLWKQYKQLKNKKTEAELALLKSNIDPHFFFNTLNNLYGLAVEKSDKAPEIILKLSDIMRYTIYEGKNDTVSIKDEISYLEQYIEIHKIRYKKKVDITFEKDISDENLQIPPLLFIMLLENAIKHGIESLTDNAYINLKLHTNDNEVFFNVENNYEENNINKKGIGLENLKRRLQLLYPKKHQLLLLKTIDKVFLAQLTIKLK